MGKRKPRMDSTQRVLARMRQSMSKESITRLCENRELCPEHLHYQPCFKCKAGKENL